MLRRAPRATRTSRLRAARLRAACYCTYAVHIPACAVRTAYRGTPGGHVIATRDYHPYDHASFYTEGGPYPPHCVQGTVGAQLVPQIAEALAKGIKQAGSERVSVCFKGMHEQVDSF